MTTNESIHALSLRDIAAWQIEGIFDGNEKAVVADLPALQRSAVWKVQQIEELWDSVLRGFPIGSFILSPPNTALLGRISNFRGHVPVNPRENTPIFCSMVSSVLQRLHWRSTIFGCIRTPPRRRSGSISPRQHQNAKWTTFSEY